MRHDHDSMPAPLVVGVLVWIFLMGPIQAQQTDPATTHPWAKFGLGSWKKVRVYKESLNEAGEVESTSVTDTKTTLVEISDSGFSLNVEVLVEVAGKRFTAEPKVIRQGFHGETSGQTVNIQSTGPGEVVIDGQTYPIEIRKVVINGDELKRVSLVHYSELVSPHVLKRETKATDINGGKSNYESVVEVVAVDMPYRVLTETKLVSQVKTTHKQANGNSSVTLELHCDDVPGGVISHSLKELNAQNRVVSRSVLELTEYQVVHASARAQTVPTMRRRVFHRARNR